MLDVLDWCGCVRVEAGGWWTASDTWHPGGNCCDVSVTCRSPRENKSHYYFLFSLFLRDHPCKLCSSFFSLFTPANPLDVLSKDEFLLRQKVEPFIYYTEKHGAFECVTHQNVEAVAAKVCSKIANSAPSKKKQDKQNSTNTQLVASHCNCRANTACWRPS